MLSIAGTHQQSLQQLPYLLPLYLTHLLNKQPRIQFAILLVNLVHIPQLQSLQHTHRYREHVRYITIVVLELIIHLQLLLRRNITLGILVIRRSYQRITQNHLALSIINVQRVNVAVLLPKKSQPQQPEHQTLHPLQQFSFSKRGSLMSLLEYFLPQSGELSQFKEQIALHYSPTVAFILLKNIVLQFR